MADSGNTTGPVAIVVIFVVVVIGGFFAYRSGMLGDGERDVNIDVKTSAPAAPAPKAPAPKAP